MTDIRIARSWDELNPVVYDGDEPVSTRVLEKNHRDLESRLLIQSCRIEELEAQQKWVPVSERLPESKGVYLTVIDLGIGTHKIVFWHGHYWKCRTVTHWMPLPAPPQETE